MYEPETYHVIQEMQKYNINDSRPHVQQFQNAIRKVRQVQRMKKQRGFAFSQAEEGGQEKIIRMYDTTQKRGKYGELQDASANPFSDNNGFENDGLGNTEPFIENPFADDTRDTHRANSSRDDFSFDL